jgi:ABC-2 type transport system permease protein
MTVAALVDKTAAIVRRDLLTAIRYRSAFVITTVGAVAELTAFYFLARAIGPSFRPEGMAYFPFLVVGTGLYTFLLMSMNSFVSVIQEAQHNGTLEVMLTTATPAPLLVVLSTVSSFAQNVAQLTIYVGVGLLLSAAPLHANVVACALVLGLTALIVVAIGLIAAALQLALQKGSAVIWLIGSVTWLMTGTIFPAAALPTQLRPLSQAIPLTHSLAAMRLALLQGASLSSLASEVAVLAVFAAALLPASLWVFSAALRRARLEGTLSFY